MPDALSLSQSELPEEIAKAIEALRDAEHRHGGSYFSDSSNEARLERLAEQACEALTAAILSRLGEAERERDLLAYRVCEIHNDRARALQRVEKRVTAALDDACRMSAILLMAGEMSPQERRTAQAVANGLAAKVRSALSEAPPQGDH